MNPKTATFTLNNKDSEVVHFLFDPNIKIQSFNGNFDVVYEVLTKPSSVVFTSAQFTLAKP